MGRKQLLFKTLVYTRQAAKQCTRSSFWKRIVPLLNPELAIIVMYGEPVSLISHITVTWEESSLVPFFAFSVLRRRKCICLRQGSVSQCVFTTGTEGVKIYWL